MGIIIGGPTAWKVHRSGQLVVAFHWVNREPSMCLFPVRRSLGAAAFIIPLGSAWSYATNRGEPTPRCLSQAFLAAQVMAMDQGKDTIRGIVDAIMDNLHELVRMPNEPQSLTAAQSQAIGEVALYHGRPEDGQRIAGGEVMDEPDDEYAPTPGQSLILQSHLH